MSRLVRAEVLLFALLGAHVLDHAVNQPTRDLPAGGGLVGLAGFVVVAAAIALAVARRPSAPLAAVVAGAGTVAGFIVVHLLPEWGGVSDPYWDFSANALSWLLIAAPMLVAAGVATLGAAELRARPATA